MFPCSPKPLGGSHYSSRRSTKENPVALYCTETKLLSDYFNTLCRGLTVLSFQASIEDRISVCGQLIGMSHFMHGFVGVRPALCKLQTEKVATVHSGQYTLVMSHVILPVQCNLIKWSRKQLQIENLGFLVILFSQALRALALTCAQFG